MKFDDEDIEEFDDELDSAINSYTNKKDIIITTHERINQELCGEIEKIDHGVVNSVLTTIPEMVADSKDLIHSGFIFSAANYAAMVAVNEKNVILVASECQFLAPVKLGDIVNFTAKVRHKEGKKRNVNVVANVHNIKIFEGEFKTVITDNHVLRLKLIQESE